MQSTQREFERSGEERGELEQEQVEWEKWQHCWLPIWPFSLHVLPIKLSICFASLDALHE